MLTDCCCISKWILVRCWFHSSFSRSSSDRTLVIRGKIIFYSSEQNTQHWTEQKYADYQYYCKKNHNQRTIAASVDVISSIERTKTSNFVVEFNLSTSTRNIIPQRDSIRHRLLQLLLQFVTVPLKKFFEFYRVDVIVLWITESYDIISSDQVADLVLQRHKESSPVRKCHKVKFACESHKFT